MQSSNSKSHIFRSDIQDISEPICNDILSDLFLEDLFYYLFPFYIAITNELFTYLYIIYECRYGLGKYVGENKYKTFSSKNANTMLWIFITQLVNVSIFPIIIIIRNQGVYVPFYPPYENKSDYIPNLGAWGRSWYNYVGTLYIYLLFVLSAVPLFRFLVTVNIYIYIYI